MWASMIGLPIIIFYTVGCPLVMLIILYKNSHKLNHLKIRKYYLLMYQGFRNEVFYWEFVNTLRKIFMVLLKVMMTSIPPAYAALGLVIIFVIMIRTQIRLSPYKNEANNALELEAMIVGTTTLYTGVLFTQENDIFPVFISIVLI